MSLDAFTARPGIDDGRVPLGDGAVFVLGSLTPGRVHDLEVGDYAEVAQDADLTNVDLVRVDATVTTPDTLPGFAWDLAICVDGVAIARRRLRTAAGRRVREVAANVAGMSGVHTVAFRLELVRS